MLMLMRRVSPDLDISRAKNTGRMDAAWAEIVAEGAVALTSTQVLKYHGPLFHRCEDDSRDDTQSNFSVLRHPILAVLLF